MEAGKRRLAGDTALSVVRTFGTFWVVD
jgi:hypothetical protein